MWLLLLLLLLAVVRREHGKGEAITKDAPKSSPAPTAIDSTVAACKALKDTLQYMPKQTGEDVFSPTSSSCSSSLSSSRQREHGRELLRVGEAVWHGHLAAGSIAVVTLILVSKNLNRRLSYG